MTPGRVYAGPAALCAVLSLAPACRREAPRVSAAAAHAASDVLATVNGEPVLVAEMQSQIAWKRAEVADYFFKKYHAEQSPSFWTASYGAERPIDLIRARALTELVKIKVQEQLLQKHGVRGDASHAAATREVAEDNRRRAGAPAERASIYGPSRLTEREHFVHRFSNDVIRLKEILGQGELKCADDEVHQLYDAAREIEFRRGSARRVRRFSAIYGAAGSAGMSRPEAAQVAARARAQLAASRAVSPRDARALATAEVTYHDSDARRGRGDDRWRGPARAMRRGEVSPVVDTGASYEFAVCLDADDGPDYVPFEEARARLVKRCSDARYVEHVASLVSSAHVEVARAVYDTVTAD
jgi:hypothetical protein